VPTAATDAHVPVDRLRFPRREDRSRYIVERFGRFLADSVLDVGCDRAALRDLLPRVRYTGIDLGGTPDITIDLERADRLPFDAAAFRCVVCSDVLEHLDNLHAVFGELLRVAGRHVVLSLPNCWVNARVPIQRGRGDFAHYGLPLDRPADRHKWFFNLQQAREFVHGQAARRGDFRVVDERINEKPKPWPVRLLRRVRCLSRRRYLNRYAHTFWAVLELA